MAPFINCDGSKKTEVGYDERKFDELNLKTMKCCELKEDKIDGLRIDSKNGFSGRGSVYFKIGEEWFIVSHISSLVFKVDVQDRHPSLLIKGTKEDAGCYITFIIDFEKTIEIEGCVDIDTTTLKIQSQNGSIGEMRVSQLIGLDTWNDGVGLIQKIEYKITGEYLATYTIEFVDANCYKSH